jgi:hypothetical protein
VSKPYVAVCQATLRSKVKEGHYECASEHDSYVEARLWALERIGEMLRKGDVVSDHGYCPCDVWCKVYSPNDLYERKASNMWRVRSRAYGSNWRCIKETEKER